MLRKIMSLCFVIVFSCGVVGCESEADKQAAIEKKKQEEIKQWEKKIIGGELAKTTGNKRY